MKLYTKTGDAGETGLQGGRRVPKSDPRIMAYGALDEANAVLGMAVSRAPPALRDILIAVQNDLFVLGADLSNPDARAGRLAVTPDMTAKLERMIDETDGALPPLANFILPGGGDAGSLLHLARTVVRRAETHMSAVPAGEPLNAECLRYANRLSDLLFVMARRANRLEGMSETAWTAGPR